LMQYLSGYPQQNTPWKVGSEAGNEVTVTIRKGITTITQSAFQNCSNIVCVNIPSTVTTIGDYAFQGCTGLTTTGDDEYIFPETAVNIGNYAFDGCTTLTGKLPPTIESMGKCAFKSCVSLTGEVIINEAITTMSESTFDGCTGITSIYVPTSVTSLAYRCFANCSSLTTVTLPAGLNYVYSNGSSGIIQGAFQNDTAICDVTIIGEGQLMQYLSGYPQQNTPWKVGSEAGNEVTVTIRKGITTITQSAFQSCSNIVCVNIPSTVTTIEANAFNGCTGLTDVWYGSTMEKWNSISIGSGNTVLASSGVTIHTISINDFNGDGATTEADALYLLRHTILPARYPLSTDAADFDGNGIVNAKDAAWLKQRIN